MHSISFHAFATAGFRASLLLAIGLLPACMGDDWGDPNKPGQTSQNPHRMTVGQLNADEIGWKDRYYLLTGVPYLSDSVQRTITVKRIPTTSYMIPFGEGPKGSAPAGAMISFLWDHIPKWQSLLQKHARDNHLGEADLQRRPLAVLLFRNSGTGMDSDVVEYLKKKGVSMSPKAIRFSLFLSKAEEAEIEAKRKQASKPAAKGP